MSYKKQPPEMEKTTLYKYIKLACLWVLLAGCITPISLKKENSSTPSSYETSNAGSAHRLDTVNIADVSWKAYFDDDNLVALIDTALRKNQELNIILQEINISKNEI